jgi:hypothetical protein
MIRPVVGFKSWVHFNIQQLVYWSNGSECQQATRYCPGHMVARVPRDRPISSMEGFVLLF